MFRGCLHLRSLTLASAVLMGALLVAVAGGALVLPAAGQTVTEPPTFSVTQHKVHVVLMVLDMKTAEFLYEPKTLVVHVGDTIEWKNKDIYQHTVTSMHGKTLNSGTIEVGKSWRYTATKAGTFPYYCTLHPNMKGTLIVR